MSGRSLLIDLLTYIEEQAKVIDPRIFRLSSARDFLKRRSDLAELPGVDLDLSVEGDHVWLRVQRLHATNAPAPDAKTAALLTVGDDPNGPAPAVNEAALKERLAQASAERKSADAAALEQRLRTEAAGALERYLPQWQAWADTERPVRRSIDLYGALFAIKHQLEAE